MMMKKMKEMSQTMILESYRKETSKRTRETLRMMIWKRRTLMVLATTTDRNPSTMIKTRNLKMNNPKTKISTKCSTTSGSSNARKGRQSVKTRRSCSKARPNPSTNRTAIRIDGHIKARSLPSEDDPYSGTIKTSKCSYHFLSLSSSWLTLPSVMSRMYNKTLLFSLSK